MRWAQSAQRMAATYTSKLRGHKVSSQFGGPWGEGYLFSSNLYELIVVPTISSQRATNPYGMGTSEHEQTTTNICAGSGLKMLNTCKRIYYIIIKLSLSLYSRFTYPKSGAGGLTVFGYVNMGVFGPYTLNTAIL